MWGATRGFCVRDQVASWKTMPGVRRHPLWKLLTPWRVDAAAQPRNDWIGRWLVVNTSP
jgi:hypothetical protein